VYVDDEITCSVDTLRLEFAIGEELGDSTNTFCSIVAADIDNQGRIFVLDKIDASVREYDLLGNYIRHVARSGSGPGELLRPRGMTIMNNGNLVINAPSKKGYVIFNDSLEFVEEISIWQNNSPYHISSLTDEKVVVCKYGENPITDSLWHTVGIYDWGEEEWETLLWKDSVIITLHEMFSDPSPADLFCSTRLLRTNSDGLGSVYFAQVDTLNYRVIRWDSTGTQTLNITMDFSPVRKSPEEIAAESVYLTTRLDNTQEGGIRPYAFREMISDVGIGPDGNLWVRRGTRTDLFFDIYDLDGVLLRHAVYPIESWSWETETTSYGILAWELDPLEGYQKLYFIH